MIETEWRLKQRDGGAVCATECAKKDYTRPCRLATKTQKGRSMSTERMFLYMNALFLDICIYNQKIINFKVLLLFCKHCIVGLWDS